ncbi:unnamed protein product [Toxocara canis]|uniref:Secreted protein n=1 Tax=Toxocara canis TaxID=6265 RepID=A0A183TVQ0_TOXCA|nr:unnamed protein product [Toxocara canis]
MRNAPLLRQAGLLLPFGQDLLLWALFKAVANAPEVLVLLLSFRTAVRFSSTQPPNVTCVALGYASSHTAID